MYIWCSYKAGIRFSIQHLYKPSTKQSRNTRLQEEQYLAPSSWDGTEKGNKLLLIQLAQLKATTSYFKSKGGLQPPHDISRPHTRMTTVTKTLWGRGLLGLRDHPRIKKRPLRTLKLNTYLAQVHRQQPKKSVQRVTLTNEWQVCSWRAQLTKALHRIIDWSGLDGTLNII